MIIAYNLILSETSKPKLSVSNIEFTRCFSGQLKFRDNTGIHFIDISKHSNLEIFEVNDHALCIVEEGQFEKPEIYDSLCNFHSKKITLEIARLKKIKYFL